MGHIVGFPASRVSGGPTPPAVGTALLYTGNGSAGHGITGAGLSPDLVIIRLRPGGAGTQYRITDNVRSALSQVLTTSSSTPLTDANGTTSFDADGFTLGTSTNVNANTSAYIALLLQQVSSLFSIATWTGTGVAHTIAHGLGATPKLMLVKSLAGFNREWAIYDLSTGNTKASNWGSAVPSTGSGFWNNTSPDATNFTVGNSSLTNENGQNYVGYFFANGVGIDVGTYTGDGNTNGPVVTFGTAFRARIVIIKRLDATLDWHMWDDQRDPTSPHNTYQIMQGGANAEATTTNTAGGIDMTSTGFQVMDTAPASLNVTGGTYLYLAIG